MACTFILPFFHSELIRMLISSALIEDGISNTLLTHGSDEVEYGTGSVIIANMSQSVFTFG